jgi:RNA polymerase sigma-70 factor (ECF subfamily)
LRDALDRFLANLPAEKRVMFIKRYFFANPIAEIAESMGLGESNVKVTLHRIREQLKTILEKEELL